MSLAKLSTGEAQVTITLEDANGSPMYVDGMEAIPENALTITVVGVDSKTYRQREDEITNKQLSAVTSGKKRKKAAFSTEDRYSLIACCVKDWTNISETPESEDLECTHDNVFRVLRTYGSVFDQVSDAVEDRTLYLKN